MAEEEKLKLGKGTAFVKSRISRLPESGETWEADFEALPKPMTQTETHYYPGEEEARVGQAVSLTERHSVRLTA